MDRLLLCLTLHVSSSKRRKDYCFENFAKRQKHAEKNLRKRAVFRVGF